MRLLTENDDDRMMMMGCREDEGKKIIKSYRRGKNANCSRSREEKMEKFSIY